MELSPALAWSMITVLGTSTISLVLAAVAYGRKSKAQNDSIDNGEFVYLIVLGNKKEQDDRRKRIGLLGRTKDIEDHVSSEMEANREPKKFLRMLMDEFHVAKDSGEHDMRNAIRDALGKAPATPPTGRIPTARQMIIGDQMRRMTNLGTTGEGEIERDRFGTPATPLLPHPEGPPDIPRSQPLYVPPRHGLTPPPPPHAAQRVPRPETPFPTKHHGEKEDDSNGGGGKK